MLTRQKCVQIFKKRIGVSIDNGTHIPGAVSKSGAESDYDSSYTAKIALAYF